LHTCSSATFCAGISRKKKGEPNEAVQKNREITGKEITTMPDIISRAVGHPGRQDADGYKTAKEFIDMLARRETRA
jgi:hypothetical protein